MWPNKQAGLSWEECLCILTVERTIPVAEDGVIEQIQAVAIFLLCCTQGGMLEYWSKGIWQVIINRLQFE